MEARIYHIENLIIIIIFNSMKKDPPQKKTHKRDQSEIKNAISEINNT